MISKDMQRISGTILSAKRTHLSDVVRYAKQVKYYKAFGDKKRAAEAANKLFIAKDRYRAARRCWVAISNGEGLPLSEFTRMYSRG